MCSKIEHALRFSCFRSAIGQWSGIYIPIKKRKGWTFLEHAIVMDNDRKFNLV